MKKKMLEYLICPACLPDENALRLKASGAPADEIIEGDLECPGCGQCYPVRGGVAKIVPASQDCPNGQSMRYEEPALLSSYLWSHYSDLLKDTDALPSYEEWARQLACRGGVGLDIGCAVGRFSFEMSRKCDFAIGVDRSESFVSAARRILQERQLAFRVREEGLIQSERGFSLPEAWNSSNVEFIVGDAHALPFRAASFSCIASLNLVDKIPRPLEHLREMNRLARIESCQILLSDPFSWSEQICPPEDWLGGTDGGKYPGSGLDNISGLLGGTDRFIAPPWTITARGAVWWKIRNHRNHFELIRSQYIRAERQAGREI
jgi:SAM-dependent methyltransferase/uncharacterized protein YbaR (Trm112 family)